MVIAVYVTAITIHLLPTSPIRDALSPLSDVVVKPLFVQEWTLFAPDPIRTNHHAFVVVRYRMGSREVTTRPLDVSAVVRRANRRWGPPRVRKALATLNVAVERRAFAEVRRLVGDGFEAGDPVPDRTVRGILRGRAPVLRIWARFLSAYAPHVVPPGAEVAGLRGFLVRSDIRRFRERNRSPIRPAALPAPDAPTVVLPPDVVALVLGGTRHRSILVMDSGWMPRPAGVAQVP